MVVETWNASFLRRLGSKRVLDVAWSHRASCRCGFCRVGWALVGPDEDGRYGPFSPVEIAAVNVEELFAEREGADGPMV